MTLIFDPSRSSKVKYDGVNRKPVGPTTKCSLWSNLISVTVFEIFRVKILTLDLSTLAGLTPGPKFTKRRADLVHSEIYHPAKLHRSTPTHARDIPYKIPSDTRKQTVNDISPACLSACGIINVLAANAQILYLQKIVLR